MRKSINVLLLCFTLLLSALPVSAAAPTRYDGVYEDVFVLADCGDFLIYDHEIGNYTVTTYTNQQGVPIRESLVFTGVDRVYASTQPDHVLVNNFAVLNQYDLVTGEWKNSGVSWHVRAPHVGNLFLITGHMVVENDEVVFRAGVETADNDIDAFCAYFR